MGRVDLRGFGSVHEPPFQHSGLRIEVHGAERRDIVPPSCDSILAEPNELSSGKAKHTALSSVIQAQLLDPGADLIQRYIESDTQRRETQGLAQECQSFVLCLKEFRRQEHAAGGSG